MNKRLILGGLILVVLLTPVWAQAQNAKITSVLLDVRHRASDSSPWLRSRVGTQLPPGSRVRTGKRSKCEISFPDGSFLRLAPQSDLVIVKVTGKDLSLGHGRLYAKVVAGTLARIQGSTGVAAIKGTTLDFSSGGTGGDDQLTIYEGAAQFSNPQGSVLVTSNTSSQMGGGRGPSGSAGVPSETFPGGQPGAWWGGMAPGQATMAMPGSVAGFNQRTDTVGAGRQPFLDLPGRQDPGAGAVNVVISSLSAKPSASLAGHSFAMAWPPPEAALEIAPVTLAQATPASRLGKRFFGPEVLVDTFASWGDERTSFAGIRVRPTAVWGDFYAQVGATGWTDFQRGWRTVLSEGFVTYRPKWGDVTAGRQHFVDGPVNNSAWGSLIGFDTADALRWEPGYRDWKFDLAYVDNFFPLQGYSRSGWYARTQTSRWGGTFGLNAVHHNDVGTGVSFDFSVPVVPGEFDVYGELGSDPRGAHLSTYGAYFPGLYQRQDIDLFIEYAERGPLPSLTSAYAYKEFGNDFTGLLSYQHSSQDDTAAIGLVKRFK